MLIRSVVLALCALLLTGPAARAASRSGAEVQAEVDRVARAWLAYQQPDGSIRDPLEPAAQAPAVNYGTLMLADVLADAGRRSGDAQLVAAADRIISAAQRGPVPSDPFNLLAGASLASGQQAAPNLTVDVRGWAGRIGPFRYDGRSGRCLATPGCFNNWRLVWAAGAAQLHAAGVLGEPGTLAGERQRTFTQIDEALALALRHAGPRSDGPLGPSRSISDPGDHPQAYHLFALVMLERTIEQAPELAGADVRQLADQAARRALEMMMPDGQLTWSGRSMEQSWVLAAAADLGARRAARGGRDAGRWRTFADRALERLQVVHGHLADGTVPVVPALRVGARADVMDSYAAHNQYSGLTLWLLADAAAHWPERAATRAPLPSEQTMIVADPRGSAQVWGAEAGVAWALGMRQVKAGDGRYAPGLALAKVRRAGRWTDLLAMRPIDGPASAIVLQRGDRRGALTLTGIRGRALQGRFGQLRRARVTARGGRSQLTIDFGLRAGERLLVRVWAPSTTPALAASGARVRLGRCTFSASGRACLQQITITRPGVLRVG